MEAFRTQKTRPKGPGWESAPNRAMGNGDYEGAAELRRRARSPPRGTQDGGVAANFRPHDQKRPSTTPAQLERPHRQPEGHTRSHPAGAAPTVAEQRRTVAASSPTASTGAERRAAGSVSPAVPAAPPGHTVTKSLGKAREKQLEQLRASGEMTFKSERIGDGSSHAHRR
eukprot:jgi/Ulvmu1/9008/UM005_0099.1